MCRLSSIIYSTPYFNRNYYMKLKYTDDRPINPIQNNCMPMIIYLFHTIIKLNEINLSMNANGT